MLPHLPYCILFAGTLFLSNNPRFSHRQTFLYMFNSKALWWTFLGFWIAGSIYWHVCKIEQYCDMLFGSQALLPETATQKGQFHISLRDLGLPVYRIEVSDLGQHAIMVAVALLLGFILGNTYEIKKTRDLRYKLNRIDRELEYYQSKQ